MTNLPLIIGHRGASRHAPENTLAAFQMAIDAGADGIEIDVRLARDGVPVVIHDADLLRTAGLKKKIADLTSTELAGIDVGSWFNAKSTRRSHTSFADQTVPRLDEVLELLAGFKELLYIELKTDARNREALIEAVCERIRNSPMLSQVIVKSFDLKAVASVKHHLPAVQTAALFGPDVRHLFKRRRRLIELARSHGADQLSIHRSLVTGGLMRAAHAASMQVTVWTADDPRWIRRAQRLGIRALITNDPVKLLGVLRSAANY
jgi:glycerophosphoryl diester phosphodiesterase